LRCPISNNVTCKVRNGKNPSTRVNTLAETAKRSFPPLADDFPFLGLISGLLIVAQAWLLARILNHMIMENIPARSAPDALYRPGPDFCSARLGGLAA
jgi:hypothetical protein